MDFFGASPSPVIICRSEQPSSRCEDERKDETSSPNEQRGFDLTRDEVLFSLKFDTVK